ncbi:hypothetical protein GM658_00515 [Pseudoduganella eburnea]|uniref:Uncharacterized protein n=1 Tax=Massilia eburnea TaxID=1776165 RepID=A0A6L6QA16_9BURK|nr:hypothetical protein [Massilia eburnea]MTW09070.1 hypothetical protein [Massilia eburnea]
MQGLLLFLLAHSATAQPLCQTNEKTYFSCPVAGSHKTASVCGDVRDFERPRLEYRFGTSKHIELIYPALPFESLQKFEFNQAISKPDNSELNELYFKNGDYYYGVTSYIADNEHGRVKERSIAVFDRDQILPKH